MAWAVRVEGLLIAFNQITDRVQRSLDGGESRAKVAYRPPQIDRAERNALEWIDFLAPPCVAHILPRPPGGYNPGIW